MPSVNRKVIANQPKTLGSASDYTRAIQDEASQLVVTSPKNPIQRPLLRLFRTPLLAEFTNRYNPFIPAPWTGGSSTGTSGLGGVFGFTNNANGTSPSYLTVNSKTGLALGTNVFTCEFFMKVDPATGVYGTYFSMNGASFGFWADAVSSPSTDRTIVLSVGGTNYNSTSVKLPAISYTSIVHYAIIARSSSRVDLYINGSRVISSTSSRSSVPANPLVIGSRGTNFGFTGEITNFHIARGVALYPDAPTLTIPRVPLSPVAQTTVLLLAESDDTKYLDSADSTTITPTTGTNPITWTSKLVTP